MRALLVSVFLVATSVATSAQTMDSYSMVKSQTNSYFHYSQLSMQYAAAGINEYIDLSDQWSNIMLDNVWNEGNSAFQKKDFSYGEVKQVADNWQIYGMSAYDNYVGMGAMRSALVGWSYLNDKWRLDVSLTAAKYAFDAGMGNRFSVSGSLSYSFNDNISAYVFGSYMPSYNFYSPALMPYLGYSNFGGAVSFSNEYVGVDLGVKRYLDPFTAQWTTQPIVMPFINVNGQKMGFDIGRLLQDVFRSFMFNASQEAFPTHPDFNVKGAPTPVKTALTPGKRY